MEKSSTIELRLSWKFTSFFLRIEEMVDPIYAFICAQYITMLPHRTEVLTVGGNFLIVSVTEGEGVVAAHCEHP